MHLGSGILATVSFIQQKVHLVSTDGVTGYFFLFLHLVLFNPCFFSTNVYSL